MKWSKDKWGCHTNKKDKFTVFIEILGTMNSKFYYTIRIKEQVVVERFGYSDLEEAKKDAETELEKIYKGVSCILAGCR